MFTTTPLRSPVVGTMPLPMIVSEPSRPISPISVHTFDVPTSIPTMTASRSTCRSVPRCKGFSARGGLQEVPSDECHVLEDPWAEGDQGDEIEIDSEPITDERQENCDDGIDNEPADEDPIVVDAVELRAHRAKDGVQRGHDGHGGIPGELEADVDLEEETQYHAHQETCQGEQHRMSVLVGGIWPRLPESGAPRQLVAQVTISAWGRARSSRPRARAASRRRASAGPRDIGPVQIRSQDD